MNYGTLYVLILSQVDSCQASFWDGLFCESSRRHNMKKLLIFGQTIPPFVASRLSSCMFTHI